MHDATIKIAATYFEGSGNVPKTADFWANWRSGF